MVIIDYKSQISVVFLDIYLSSIYHRCGDVADSLYIRFSRVRRSCPWRLRELVVVLLVSD